MTALLVKKPHRSATVQSGTIRVGHLDRTYLSYVPKNLPANAPIVFVLHGATQSAQEIRVSTGYEFERLADEHGFAVVYPNGYEHHWNDCRKGAHYAAKERDVDDNGFILALIDHFHSTAAIDRSRVFVMGYSNGGHMAFRLALELPDRITAIAAVAANLPTDENCDCEKSGLPVPVMILNGTSDPINPYDGGHVRIFGFGDRGTVQSSRDSAEYFAQLNGQDDSPEVSRIWPANGHGKTAIEKREWNDPGKPEVVLESVKGGGHVVPQPAYRAPFLFGRTTHVINGPEEIWNFFARQPSLDRSRQKP